MTGSTRNLLYPKKAQEAQIIVDTCCGPKGVWASPYRYKDQCWTRDFTIAIVDLLLEDPTRHSLVKRHLAELSRKQRKDGRIPIMFLDNTMKWLWNKVKTSIKNRRLSFLLRRFFIEDGIEFLSPWTRDSEYLYVLGVMKYVRATNDQRFFHEHHVNILMALGYVRNHLTRNDGLVRGSDWRDTRVDLDDKYLLTNNALLHQVHSLCGSTESARVLRDSIEAEFWTGTHYRDYPGVDDFDTLGNALMILFDIAPKEQWEFILCEAEELSTPFGFKLNGVTLPPKDEKEAELMSRIDHNGVVWPWINGFMVLAMIKAGRIEEAREEFEKWNNLRGFWEYYDPETGEGHGSKDQMWSASMYLRVAKVLGL